MSKLPYKIQTVQDELSKLSTLKNFEQTQRVILSVVKLLDDTISENDLNLFQLFNDTDRKIYQNASWFFEDQVIADRKATYKVHAENKLNVDFKVYGVNKASKRVVAWSTALTPNFEDEPFNSKFNLGIDFIVPKSTDRVIVVLTNNYVIRTLELKGDLTATFQEIFGKWLEIKDFSNKTSVHTALWESFDLQPLNKKFYAGISERFITLRQHLIKENILDEKYASMFANRLIGRVIFTWFLDKKGIINPDLKYFDSHSFESDSEYYKAKLERLFFGVLNTPIDEREYKDELTPFLNGGLFEARQNDLYKDSKLSFPKNYFDDVFDFLSGYNFTTDESTSQFQQVAIDPEMLGRIFENLLAEITEETGEQARKAKGAFYTPREIVDYMCKESLKEYLKTKLQEDTYRDQRLYQLIDAPDKDFQDQDHNWRRDWKPYKDAIITALDDLKVLDPACGSGAFPIGMLQLLVSVYERLEPRFDGYKAKLQIIENNIYGVDIEPMAVEIARLRTWLSIVVDEDSDSKKIKPLPNLEFKFVCANSLIDLIEKDTASIGEDVDFAEKIRSIRDAYFNTESLNKKKKLKEQYELIINEQKGLFGESEKSLQLKTYKPFDNESSASFFNPDFMFGISAFDLVIGNPPYVASYGRQAKKFDAKEIEYYIKNYQTFSSVSNRKKVSINTIMLFFERGLSLIKDLGGLSYIIDQAFLNVDVYSHSRKYIVNNSTLTEIVTDLKFPQVIAEACILHLIKNKKESYQFLWKKKNIISESQQVSISEINKDDYQFILSSNTNIIKTIERKSSPLCECAETFTGMQIIPEYFLSNDDSVLKSPKWHKAVFSNNVYKYNIVWPIKNQKGKYITYDTDLQKQVRALLKKRIENGEKCRAPETLSIGSDEKEYRFHTPKIILSQTVSNANGIINLQACLDDKIGYYGNVSIHLIKHNDVNYLKYLLGIINSKLICFYAKEKKLILGAELGSKKTPQIRKGAIDKLPIINISSKEQEPFIRIVDEIIKSRELDFNMSIKNLEDQIDDLVYKLYGLNNEEIEIIKKNQ